MKVTLVEQDPRKYKMWSVFLSDGKHLADILEAPPDRYLVLTCWDLGFRDVTDRFHSVRTALNWEEVVEKVLDAACRLSEVQAKMAAHLQAEQIAAIEKTLVDACPWDK